MIRLCPLAALAAFVLAACVQPAAAQTADELALTQKLDAAKALACSFTLLATGTWEDGVPKGEVKPVIWYPSAPSVS